jgi:alpha/beta superfamily hydrolase
LQLGYQVVTYDFRNHGSSDKSSFTFGKVEANDLEDVISWVQKFCPVSKVGLYGFS